MKPSFRNVIVVLTFALVAGAGILLSLSAPHLKSDDELVYLTGALQVRDGNLPDAYMLQGYEYGPYIHPHVMLAWYEELGHDTFKSIVLFVFVVATGLAAYVLFRSLLLPWIPSLLLSIMLLMPRIAAGTEFFGLFAFREAIGRSGAVPVFLIGTALIIRRLIERKSLWPVFGLIGLCIFFHPVTVTLFAFVSLLAAGITLLILRTPVLSVIRQVLVSGTVFVLAGSYFFVNVASKLLQNVASEGVSSAAYVSAVLFRNAWEFPAASFGWFKHMGIVSLFFVLGLILFYTLPYLKKIRANHTFPHEREVLAFGGMVAILSLVLTIAIPGLNLYFMEHADAPYAFQQWSRISKFYYLGLFVALVPAAYVLWQWFLASTHRLKILAFTAIVAMGIASSSLGFEVLQFAIGYKNFERSYIPQALSGLPDDITSQEYRETCAALATLGATPSIGVMSPDFGLRYYCRANLFVTLEEGAAYTYLLRSDLVIWHRDFLAQRGALNSGDADTMLAFAKSINAGYIVVARAPKYAALEALKNHDVTLTKRHILVRVNQVD